MRLAKEIEQVDWRLPRPTSNLCLDARKLYLISGRVP